MKISRRKFFITTTALGVANAYPNLVLSKDLLEKDNLEKSVGITTDLLVQYFIKTGFVAVPAAPMISGHAFNGGLNYDEDFTPSNRQEYLIQRVSRVEDVAKKNQPGTLPLFTILGYMQPKGGVNEHANFVLDCLIGRLHLDPKRMQITSTELIKSSLTIFKNYGIQENQIQLRSLAEAKKAGDGSGWFEPAGHHKQVSIPTYSIEYLMPDDKYLEIAEMGVDHLAGAFGIERITMAKNQAYFSWGQYLLEFKNLIQAEANKNNKALPVGYYEILGVSKPL